MAQVGAWTVGTTFTHSRTNSQPLIEHWNGTNWRLVPGPTPQLSGLMSVAVVSPDNIWAVGAYNSSSGGALTLVEHWNGTIWATVTSPSPANYSYLNSVVAVSAGHVWAVGVASDGGNGIGKPLNETRC